MNPREIITEVIEHLRGMWRYRWAALGLAWVIVVGGSVFVLSIPDVYRASAKISVDTNELLRPLMQGLTAAQQNPLNAVQAVSRSVLTRPNLEAVAHTTDLTLRAESRGDVERIVSDLQQDIRVTGDGRDNVFTVVYDHPNRAKAVEVVDAFLDTFVETAIGGQGDDADASERALSTELEDHRRRLNEAEAALAEFRRANVGYMPGESGDYSARLQAALTAAEQTQTEISRMSERRDELGRQVAGEEPVFGIMPNSGPAGFACSQRSRIVDLETQVADLLVDSTENHPRYDRLRELIETQEQLCTAERERALAAGVTSSVPSTQPLAENPVHQSMRIQLSEAVVALADLQAKLRSEQEAIEQLRRDVDKIAEVERELKELTRHNDVLAARYQELYSNWEDLQATKRLGPVTEQVRYRRIEPPFAGEEAVGPPRQLYLSGVSLLAAGGSFGLAFGLNLLVPAFFSRRSLERAVDLPVLGSVSMVLSPRETADRRRSMLFWIIAALALAAVILAVYGFSEAGSGLVRSALEG